MSGISIKSTKQETRRGEYTLRKTAIGTTQLQLHAPRRVARSRSVLFGARHTASTVAFLNRPRRGGHPSTAYSLSVVIAASAITVSAYACFFLASDPVLITMESTADEQARVTLPDVEVDARV